MRKAPLKKRSAKTKAQKVRHADRLWAAAVASRARLTCEMCGKPGSDAHHMKSRRSHYLRWSLCNGVFLCKACHMRFHNQEAFSLWEWFRGAREEDFKYVVSNLHAIAPKTHLDTMTAALEAWHETNGT